VLVSDLIYRFCHHESLRAENSWAQSTQSLHDKDLPLQILKALPELLDRCMDAWEQQKDLDALLLMLPKAPQCSPMLPF
jgi:hypothetical protein